MLAPTNTSSPRRSNGAFRASSRRSGSFPHWPAVPGVSTRSTQNSSPPMRARMSPSASEPESRNATSWSSSSPPACPKVSLTCLKRSRSIYARVTRAPLPAARETALRRLSSRDSRFGRLVSESKRAWKRSCSANCRCSIAMAASEAAFESRDVSARSGRRTSGRRTLTVPSTTPPPVSIGTVQQVLIPCGAKVSRHALQRGSPGASLVTTRRCSSTARERGGVVLGTVSVLLPEVRRPERADTSLLSNAASLAAIAIEQRQFAEQLLFQARFDSLTSLPNRLSLEESLRSAVSRAAGSGARVTLAYIDLDRFKQVNDTLGHAGGDELL